MTREKTHLPFTLELMENALRDVGLQAGDKVFVHSSLRDIASYRELAKLPHTGMGIILDAFKNVITEDGLIGFPTLTPTYVDSKKDPSSPVWDRAETSSWVGSITNYAWQQPDAFRSNHPTHSVTAWGSGEEEFVKGHNYDDDSTFGKTTPWGKMFKLDFKLLFLGTWFNTCTAIHLSEDWLGLPCMTPEATIEVMKNRKEGDWLEGLE